MYDIIINGEKIGVLPSVLMVYSGELVKGESILFVAGDPFLLDARSVECKVVAFGHRIAMDWGHGVFLLAASFALR